MTNLTRWERLYRWYMRRKYDPCTAYMLLEASRMQRRLECALWHEHEQWTGTKYRMHQTQSGVHKWSTR